jgi:aminoglycoside 2''-phosphotransferase
MQNTYEEQIRAVYPEFELHVCELEDSGQYNDVLFVNNAYVFRFPRFPQGISKMAGETRLLTWLQGKLPLSVPNPCFQYLDETIPGKAFMGYFVIPGETLTRQKLHTFKGQPAWKGMAAQLGDFLRVLHGLDIASLGVELPIKDDRAFWAMMYAEIRELLFDAMRPDARQAISRHFEIYLDTAQSQPFVPCLRHGDFGPSNILYDVDQMAVQGILDFSSMAMGDPAVDLSSLSCYGDEFLQAALIHYPAEKGVLERAKFYRGTFALQEALAGAKLNDQRAYKAGMALYI